MYEDGRSAANRFGDADRIRWFDAERMYEWYWEGRWDELAGLADEVIGRVDAGLATAIEMDARLLRSRIRIGRDEKPAALDDSARALELGRRAGYPEMVVPALALHARTLEASGRPTDAVACTDELLSLWPENCPTSYWLADVAVTLHLLGRSGRLLEAAVRAPTRSPWLEAAIAVATGKLQQAAELYGGIGSSPDAAMARLLAVRALASAGMSGQARAELERALVAFRQFGASLYLREGEALQNSA